MRASTTSDKASEKPVKWRTVPESALYALNGMSSRPKTGATWP